MRSTIIPAQITTVEDKIAGSLNFAQILLLLAPVLWATLVYAFLAPAMKLVPYKVVVVLIVAMIFMILAIRIKDKIIAQWLTILLSYRLRPKHFLADKNDMTGRMVDLPILVAAKSNKKVINSTKVKVTNEPSIEDLIKLEQVLSSANLAVSYQYGKKG